ncbi:SGNH/GDSL hydrolase family protein [Paenibacillus sp. FSL M7-1046]|uniref:SGNH/GDSL hydrolase family protein n=1 Tax=Paenibacillus sp. FSL M7-1046 TaxID=2975315 RepID=UPI0030F766DA
MRKLFVVGDSISIKYGPYLKVMVGARFFYDRKRGEDQALADLDKAVGSNGGDSGMVLDYLLSEQKNGVKYDVLLINCGLHDIKTDPLTGQKQVPTPQYKYNIENISELVKKIATVPIWVRTTDAIESIHNSRSTISFHRYHEDVEAYNAIADEIMAAGGISILDLYSFTKVFGDEAYIDHVHFNQDVQRMQAAFIAGFLDNRI